MASLSLLPKKWLTLLTVALTIGWSVHELAIKAQEVFAQVIGGVR